MIPPDDPRFYASWWAEGYDDEHVHLDPSEAVALLSELVSLDDGPVLELGVGTGRVALPLAAKGVEVHGLDVAEEMLAVLRADPAGAAVRVIVADMAAVPDDIGPYGVVYLAYNTLSHLVSQDAQLACVTSASRVLRPGGRFVVEGYLPDLGELRDGRAVQVLRVRGNTVRLSARVYAAVDQRVDAVVFGIGDDATPRPLVTRYTWPSELDLMARAGGLHLLDRWGGWSRQPFTASSRAHVSVYAKDAEVPG